MEQEKKKLLEVFDIQKNLKHKKNLVSAFEDVSLYLIEGEAIGVVGDDKSGKVALAHVLAGIEKVDYGSITLLGNQIAIRRMKKFEKIFAAQNIQILPGGLNHCLHRESVYDILCNAMVAAGTDERVYASEISQHLQVIKHFRESLKMFCWSKLFDYKNKVIGIQEQSLSKLQEVLKHFAVNFETNVVQNLEILKEKFLNSMEATQFDDKGKTNLRWD